ncbi:hypothetical protein WI23_24305 [Burkholderia oklahomensis C6786]|nr:hypothetical protein WI23_24305 [Burkholderia oklahomensis C6786]
MLDTSAMRPPDTDDRVEHTSATSGEGQPRERMHIPNRSYPRDFSKAVISFRFDVDALEIRPKRSFCIGFHPNCNDAAGVGFESYIGIQVRVHIQAILAR